MEFIGRSLAPRARRGQRFASGPFGLDVNSGYRWDLAKNEKTNLETGDVISMPPEVVEQEKNRLGL